MHELSEGKRLTAALDYIGLAVSLSALAFSVVVAVVLLRGER